MTHQKRRFKAVIEGETYTIIGPHSEEHMQVVVETVNEQLKQLTELSVQLDGEKKAMLMAINAVSDQLQMHKELNEMQEKLNQLKNEQ
ncbi:cell division protein ZapA [Lacticigenium naphthae]|uniref:cell division protein ZapA n=1 Tax=Lacticigenium naphthae TaxID=515351 RepID=UPI0004084875|nr:cell division protein ZapA [Lacticigenium naphthae]